METGEALGPAKPCDPEFSALSLTWRDPGARAPTWQAFILPWSHCSSQSWGSSIQSSASLHSVRLTCTSWTVTTAITNRYERMEAPPASGSLAQSCPGSLSLSSVSLSLVS